MQNNRPININPLTIKLPVPALVSIGHRLSGLIVFLFLPVVLWILEHTLKSETSFNSIQTWFSALWVKVLLWGFIVGLVFHLLAGVRHLLMDCHLGDSLKVGRFSAFCVLLVSLVIAIWTAWYVGSAL